MYLGLVLREARKDARSAKPSFLAISSHLGLDAVHLAQTELVDLVRRHVRGGPGVNVVLVALLAVRQRSDREGGAALGRVFRAEKRGECLVGGNDVAVDGVGDLLRQALLIFEGDARRIFLCRQQKWIGVDDALTLDGELLQQESDGHELVLHAGAQDFGGLAEDARNLVQTGDVVLVVLDGVEGDGKRQIREAGMDAVLLVDRHLVLFEIEVGDALLKHANEEVVGELVLVGEAGRRDGFQPGQESPRPSCGAGAMASSEWSASLSL